MTSSKNESGKNTRGAGYVHCFKNRRPRLVWITGQKMNTIQ